MTQVTIREAVIQDIPQLKTLMLAYIVDFYQYRQPEDEKLNGLIHQLLEQKEGIQFVAETEEGTLVGFATLYFTFSTLRASKIAIMNDLFVIEAERGQGAAAKLFAACKGYAARNGYANLTWTTAKDNFRAQAFYDKMGGDRSDWQTYSANPTSGMGD
ncbi:GNAT superfamily N-acetyltransferase [Paenibacillus sp. V4I3]|uniref:GNAT family N-acetyltransferase n=1 Tax=unclassified Paenibacillus TaxID=185978 RepID=UPI00278AD180|nr:MULTISPECIES: GNAT family N-acetyltransferase [unclassified Paenibacillus]MDQ0872542.1 GNAT superfamily N-acetyltransferase [Paenibacillus sp. V4I3]MDQ0891573.1 GNAT superfamily N-acetyltransferase [Paenibacillus sp. V4I9]